MKTVAVFILIVAMVMISTSCNQAVTGVPPNDKSFEVRTPHFVIQLTELDGSNSDRIQASLEQNYERITSDLQVDTLPVITVIFYQNGDEFRKAAGMGNLPSWATSSTRLLVVSPSSPDAGRSFEEMLNIIVHEFTHCVTLNINSSFANNPRWLWEGVSLYEAGQFSHPSRLTGWPSNIPTLADLNSNWQTNTDVYTGGYVLIEYIIQAWTKDKLIQLIRSNGNILGTLGVSVQQFEQGWLDFLITKYGE
jgi:hypothetical protein